MSVFIWKVNDLILSIKKKELRARIFRFFQSKFCNDIIRLLFHSQENLETTIFLKRKYFCFKENILGIDPKTILERYDLSCVYGCLTKQKKNAIYLIPCRQQTIVSQIFLLLLKGVCELVHMPMTICEMLLCVIFSVCLRFLKRYFLNRIRKI